VTKSTPFGSIDHPFNPMALALGADATFVARSMDRDPSTCRQCYFAPTSIRAHHSLRSIRIATSSMMGI
jgi:hypothetical protein